MMRIRTAHSSSNARNSSMAKGKNSERREEDIVLDSPVHIIKKRLSSSIKEINGAGRRSNLTN